MSVIWIISRDDWLRALLRAELIERGFDAVGSYTPADALAQREQRTPRLIVIDLSAAERDQVQPLFDLKVPVLGFGGALDLDQTWVGELPWSALMRRPISIGNIADRLAALT